MKYQSFAATRPSVAKAAKLLSPSSRQFSAATSRMAGDSYVKRTTLFKVPEQHIDAVLKAYDVLRATATKDGKPYVVSNVSRRITNTSSPLSEGYTISSQSIFKSREDHDFYDKECEAHKTLKQTTGKFRQGERSVMTVVTEGEWPEPKL